MKVHLECYPCFLRQALIALRLGTKDEALQHDIFGRILSSMHLMDVSKTPAHASSFMHRLIREALGSDPFGEIKSEYNKIALELYPHFKRIASESPDPLWTATRLAIAGNVIDFGIFTSVDIEGTIKRALDGPITVDDYDQYKSAVMSSDNILYLLDNTGEAVFDRILIETLASMGKKVTAVAKGGAIINDCTYADAIDAGLEESCEVIDNGSDFVGTILETTPEGFRQRFDGAGLIISKGQGNFETLHHLGGKIFSGGKIFFLFQSKCDVVSKWLGLSKGSMLLKEASN